MAIYLTAPKTIIKAKNKKTGKHEYFVPQMQRTLIDIDVLTAQEPGEVIVSNAFAITNDYEFEEKDQDKFLIYEVEYREKTEPEAGDTEPILPDDYYEYTYERECVFKDQADALKDYIERLKFTLEEVEEELAEERLRKAGEFEFTKEEVKAIAEALDWYKGRLNTRTDACRRCIANAQRENNQAAAARWQAELGRDQRVLELTEALYERMSRDAGDK